MQPGDNQPVGAIIQAVLQEFGANKPGTAYYDEHLYRLYDSFPPASSCYWVAELQGMVAGGGGIYPTAGLPAGCCELVKLYLLPQARGRGLGKALVERCLRSAKELGYRQVYLETMPELRVTVPLYEKAGFRCLQKPLGQSGHHACNIWMIKDI
ncbi:GNAT family N-acetyltransferase [Chitinophaga japonensis]